MSNFLLIAKAGGSSEGPENTGEAIARVAELRAPDGVELAIEVDLRLSADHEFVALHDARLERTTDGRGLVREHELRALRCLSPALERSAYPLFRRCSITSVSRTATTAASLGACAPRGTIIDQRG